MLQVRCEPGLHNNFPLPGGGGGGLGVAHHGMRHNLMLEYFVSGHYPAMEANKCALVPKWVG
jgi:hypothetical protein